MSRSDEKVASRPCWQPEVATGCLRKARQGSQLVANAAL